MSRARFFQLVMLLFAALLMACAGGGGGAPSGPPGAGPGPAPSLDKPPVVTTQMTGDGTLGSQSSNVDILPEFYREFHLQFQNESSAQSAALFEYILSQGQSDLPQGQVKRIQSGGLNSQKVDCPECAGRWVRALSCGVVTDDDIEKLIPENEKDSFLAKNKLLWFIINMPRPAKPNSKICDGATYRDFPVKQGGYVDLGTLEVEPYQILVFYLLEENPPSEVGPLSQGQFVSISKAQIVATETTKSGLVRALRILPAPKLNLQYLQPLPN